MIGVPAVAISSHFLFQRMEVFPMETDFYDHEERLEPVGLLVPASPFLLSPGHGMRGNVPGGVTDHNNGRSFPHICLELGFICLRIHPSYRTSPGWTQELTI